MVVVAEMKSHTKVGHEVARTVEVFHMRHQQVAYFGPQHLHALSSSLLQRGNLDSALLDDQWNGS